MCSQPRSVNQDKMDASLQDTNSQPVTITALEEAVEVEHYQTLETRKLEMLITKAVASESDKLMVAFGNMKVAHDKTEDEFMKLRAAHERTTSELAKQGAELVKLRDENARLRRDWALLMHTVQEHHNELRGIREGSYNGSFIWRLAAVNELFKPVGADPSYAGLLINSMAFYSER